MASFYWVLVSGAISECRDVSRAARVRKRGKQLQINCAFVLCSHVERRLSTDEEGKEFGVQVSNKLSWPLWYLDKCEFFGRCASKIYCV